MRETEQIPCDINSELTAKDFNLGYQPSLDGLRGISIIAVIAFNGHLLWMQGGFLGVDIFFALSGFLITSLLVREYARSSTINFRKFYFRRALRLLPALFVLMLACVGYALFIQSPESSRVTLKGILYTLFYVANWAQVPPNPPGIGPLSHAWSLSVEEQFYIIWPLVLVFLLKIRKKGVIVAIVLLLITVSLAISVVQRNAGVPYLRMYFGSDTRAHGILIGCLAALILSWGSIPRTANVKKTFRVASIFSLAGIFLSFVVLRYYGSFVYDGGFALIALGTAVIILDFLLFPSKLSRAFEFGPLVWLGKISYGLYLWHFPILEAFKKVFDGRLHPAIYGSLGVIVTLIVAGTSYYLIEQPFLRLKNRYSVSEKESLLLTDSVNVSAKYGLF